MNVSEQVLIATLGSEPHVVTLALDLLRAQGYPVSAVKVVHTMGESVQAGLKMLAEEFQRIGDDSRKGAKVAKFGESGWHFFACLASWRGNFPQGGPH